MFGVINPGALSLYVAPQCQSIERQIMIGCFTDFVVFGGLADCGKVLVFPRHDLIVNRFGTVSGDDAPSGIAYNAITGANS